MGSNHLYNKLLTNRVLQTLKQVLDKKIKQNVKKEGPCPKTDLNH